MLIEFLILKWRRVNNLCSWDKAGAGLGIMSNVIILFLTLQLKFNQKFFVTAMYRFDQ